MPKSTSGDLKKFLLPYAPAIRKLIMSMRAFVWDLYPKSNELIYDNYNAVALGWSVSEKLSHTFCTMAAFEKCCHFGFYYGNRISDPEKKLSGAGSQYRYIKLASINELPKTYIKKLLKEAYANAVADLPEGKQWLQGATIVKSISAKKKRPKPI
ncbi:MAG: hypothetical protein IPP93_16430 [Chitinophagaceae bacterium]|nr:hypothetical protein [Chitinophagaceae bacterium]MBL0333985.1 hypothetical protein [Chitinophagaceae bacterium]